MHLDLTEEQVEAVKKAFEEIIQGFAKVAKAVKEFIEKLEKNIYRWIATKAGKPGRIYLRTKSRRIRNKQRKLMLASLMRREL